jgi:hypothetical protein
MTNRTCVIEGCENPFRARGWCSTHYTAWRKYGDPLGHAPPPPSAEERFWPKVDKRGPDECWLWLAKTINTGYGQFSVGGRMMLAHRFSWELHHGPIPAGFEVCHECDNPRCVNPDGKKHLTLGTHKQNMGAMALRGRGTSKPEPFMDPVHVAVREYQRKMRAAKGIPVGVLGPPRSNFCGSNAAYTWHLNHNEPPCDACREAHRVYNVEMRRRRRGQS